VIKRLVVTTLLCVTLHGQGLSATAAGAKKTKPAKLEGMAYPKARRVILGYGWKPVSGNCGGGGTTESICKKFPEIGNCSGTGVGFCDMLFVRKRRCLSIVTVGGPPPDAVVRDVVFSAGPCSKNP
jgi:hypothetical protein